MQNNDIFLNYARILEKKFLEFLQDKQDLFVVTNKPKFVIIKASLIALGLTPTVILLSKI